MNPLSLVTIGVRALGLVLVLWHADSVARVTAFVLYYLFGRMSLDPVELLIGMNASNRPESLNLGLFALGLYLFFSGRWVISRLTRGLSWPGGSTCAKCGYDISAVDSGRCPECGTKIHAGAPRV